MKGTAVISTWLFVTLGCLIVRHADAQTVKLTFYYMDLDSWNEKSGTATLKSTLLENAITYCSTYPSDCGLRTWQPNAALVPFVVTILDGYPANVKSNLEIELSIEINPVLNLTNPLQTLLPKLALTEVVLESRSSLKTALDTWIIYVDDEHLGRPPPVRANEVIIPIAFAVVVMLIILAIALHCWRKNKDSEKRRTTDISLHGKSRVSPSHQSSPYPQKKTGMPLETVIYPPSRKQNTLSNGMSDVTATPSGITMVTDEVDESKKRHKRRHRKKKRETVEEETDSHDAQMYRRFEGDEKHDGGRMRNMDLM